MPKHIADHERDRTEGARAANYTKIEHGAGPHKGTEALQRRPTKVTEDNSSLRAFTRIERGQTA